MNNLMNVFRISGSAMTAQSIRLNTTASNLANVDSIVDESGQAYRAKHVVFEAAPLSANPTDWMNSAARGVRVQQIVESTAPGRMVFDPKNPAANEDGYVEFPNVDVVEEMANLISASRSYQSNVEVLNTTKSLILQTIQIGQS